MYRGFAEYAPFDMESKGFTEINIGELGSMPQLKICSNPCNLFSVHVSSKKWYWKIK